LNKLDYKISLSSLNVYNKINFPAMKKNPVVKIIIFIQLIIISDINSQNFNLLNPSNELYLFSAYDEGANAFRYNPAALGLKHRFNATVNALFTNNKRIELNEGDLAINFGALGLAYRITLKVNEATFSRPLNNEVTDNLSMGFGIGNKKISAGILFEYIWGKIYREPSYFDYDKSRINYGAGLLFRPNNFISASFVFKRLKSIELTDYVSPTFTFGIGVRPIGRSLLTLLADFTFTPYVNLGMFENYQLKIGLKGKIIEGFYANANYVFTKPSINDNKNESFNIGLQFDFPNFSIKYNNDFIKYINNSKEYYKSQANLFSFSYSTEKKESIIPEPKKVVEITLSGSLQDFHTEDVFFGLLGKGKRSVHEVIADIDYAASDPSVKGILLKIYPVSSGRFEINAAIEELTSAMERFRKKGKFITAYLPQDSRAAEYYIATFADKIVMPAEALFFYGLSIEIFNYKQFLEKYGIELQNFYAGDYKLIFQGVLDSTTEKGKEVINRILDAVYEKMMTRVQKSRNILIDDYLRDKLSNPITGKEAERLGLIDKNGWYDDAKNISENNTKTDNITVKLNRSEWDYGWGEEEQIAIIGVYGTIKPGESQGPSAVVLPVPYVGGGRSTGSETVVRQLEDAFANPKVKVVILRVDSGGGSALAAAEINDAIIRLKKKYNKKLIVSMGNAAASGGYFVSVSADKIFSDDLTLTGSIGVWASRPNLDSLINGQKIKVEIFKRGENSDIGSFFRKLDEEDIEIIQGIIDFYYDRFIEAISEGRKISKQDAEEIAQGRIWLGSNAFNKKLVDEIGGLYQAVIYAKKISGLDKRYKIVYYAVPGGSTINEIVSKSIAEYIQSNLLNMLGFDEDEQGLEIKY